MKKYISVILLIFFTTLSFSSFSEISLPTDANVSIVVNGSVLKLERLPAAVNGRVLVPARTVFERLGAKVDVYDNNKKVDINLNNKIVSMQAGDMYANVNTEKMEMDAAPVVLNDTLLVPVRFTAEHIGKSIEWDGTTGSVLLGNIPKKADTSKTAGNFLVAIDPGHGGKDTGAESGGIKEKNLNLDMAKRLNELLENEGIKTYMTRTDDTFIDLYERAGSANRQGADIFVSIHNNAGYSRYSGTMTLFCPQKNIVPGMFTGKNLAGIVQKELNDQLETKNLGVIARPNLVVLRETKMPAIIAEIGYMTNKTELSKLSNVDYRQKTAEALKDAVIKALNSKK